jgi:hypothetical protein
MTSGRSSFEFLEFLDWLGAKGLLPLNTAQARKAVANKVLEALDPPELEDVTALDIDHVMLRFTNKFGKRYTPESLRTYRSRFETSVSDFAAYCENPVGFKIAGRVRPSAQTGEQTEKGSTPKISPRKRIQPTNSTTVEAVGATRVSPSNVIPIQIRENLTISVGPIPFDFTAAEAKRVANVILALAVSG